jgi:tetratricopeptide (TPR) repeat protein
MRQPPSIRKSVDVELPLARCAGSSRAATAPARRAVAGAVLAAIAGCATHDASLTQQFRVEPVLSVSNAVQSAEASHAYCTLGRYFDDLHEWGRAVDAYRQAVAADPRNVEALGALGVAQAQGRHFAEAEATLRQAVALAPERTRIRNNLGYVLLLEGRPQDALAQLKLAVSQDGGSAIAQANLREAMLRSGVQPDVAVLAAAPPAAAPADTPAPMQEASAAAAPPLDASPLAVTSTPPEQLGATTTAPPPSPIATAVATPSPATDAVTLDVLQGLRLEVSNGNGMNGMAAHVGQWLAARGMPTPHLTNQQPYVQRQTVVQFRAGHEDAARRLASLLPANAQTASQASPELRSDVRVVLGRDWMQIAQCLTRASCRTPATTAAATVVAQR